MGITGRASTERETLGVIFVGSFVCRRDEIFCNCFCLWAAEFGKEKKKE